LAEVHVGGGCDESISILRNELMLEELAIVEQWLFQSWIRPTKSSNMPEMFFQVLQHVSDSLYVALCSLAMDVRKATGE
jgi:hypothetical protein